jgi:molybdate transport system substrate-binding protein
MQCLCMERRRPRRRPRARPLALALAALLLALALGPAPGGAAIGRPTVFGAASLTEVFERIDPAARFNFAGSDTLAFQIRQGAPADVFAAASPKYPDDLFERGLVRRPRAFAINSLVLIVPRANPADIAAVGDIARPGVTLVIGDAAVPIGAYTRTVLANLRLTRALSNVVSNEQDVKSVLAKVALGEADAGFVYLTDARAAAGKVRVIRLPARAQPTVDYEIAVVRASANQAAARAFVARVLGPAGRRLLRAAGFGLPPAP